MVAVHGLACLVGCGGQQLRGQRARQHTIALQCARAAPDREQAESLGASDRVLQQPTLALAGKALDQQRRTAPFGDAAQAPLDLHLLLFATHQRGSRQIAAGDLGCLVGRGLGKRPEQLDHRGRAAGAAHGIEVQ